MVFADRVVCRGGGGRKQISLYMPYLTHANCRHQQNYCALSVITQIDTGGMPSPAFVWVNPHHGKHLRTTQVAIITDCIQWGMTGIPLGSEKHLLQDIYTCNVDVVTKCSISSRWLQHLIMVCHTTCLWPVNLEYYSDWISYFSRVKMSQHEIPKCEYDPCHVSQWQEVDGCRLICLTWYLLCYTLVSTTCIHGSQMSVRVKFKFDSTVLPNLDLNDDFIWSWSCFVCKFGQFEIVMSAYAILCWKLPSVGR